MTQDESGGLRAGHAVIIECEESGYWPSLKFVCYEPADAICRTVCANPDCEEACYHVGEPGHEREQVAECNEVTWTQNGDDVAGWIAGGKGATTAVEVPVEFSWERGEDGPDWRFATAAAAPDPHPGDERTGSGL